MSAADPSLCSRDVLTLPPPLYAHLVEQKYLKEELNTANVFLICKRMDEGPVVC